MPKEFFWKPHAPWGPPNDREERAISSDEREVSFCLETRHGVAIKHTRSFAPYRQPVQLVTRRRDCGFGRIGNLHLLEAPLRSPKLFDGRPAASKVEEMVAMMDDSFKLAFVGPYAGATTGIVLNKEMVPKALGNSTHTLITRI